MIDICLWILDTLRVSVSIMVVLAAVLALGFGWEQAAFIVVMLWWVMVVLSAAVLLLAAWIRDRGQATAQRGEE